MNGMLIEDLGQSIVTFGFGLNPNISVLNIYQLFHHRAIFLRSAIQHIRFRERLFCDHPNRRNLAVTGKDVKLFLDGIDRWSKYISISINQFDHGNISSNK